MAANDALAAQVRTSTTPLASPAVVSLGNGPTSRQVFFAGEVLDAHGALLEGAVLTAWGVALHVEAFGRFELLADGAPAQPTRVPVTISEPGHDTAEVELVVDGTASLLSDGTPVLLHTFVLSGGERR